jgi:RNA polymerase sigma-70 factor (ECF subfamily)
MKHRNTTRLDPDNWVDAYGEALFGFALARVKDSDVAQDLVQETYSAALRSRRSFRGISSEKTWLFGILKHKVLDYYGRAHKIRYVNDVSPNPDDIEMILRAHGRDWINPPQATDPEKAYYYREFLDDLYRCLASLPKRAAQVFIYREIDGLSTDEICKIFGISKCNCWTILHRAKELLRQGLDCYGLEAST